MLKIDNNKLIVLLITKVLCGTIEAIVNDTL